MKNTGGARLGGEWQNFYDYYTEHNNIGLAHCIRAALRPVLIKYMSDDFKVGWVILRWKEHRKPEDAEGMVA
tara:strand:+ start:554 stop:769 length:216 start_codon:yes stop_codon:yes gene_type:complete